MSIKKTETAPAQETKKEKKESLPLSNRMKMTSIWMMRNQMILDMTIYQMTYRKECQYAGK